jgi:hypothetical protein
MRWQFLKYTSFLFNYDNIDMPFGNSEDKQQSSIQMQAM